MVDLLKVISAGSLGIAPGGSLSIVGSGSPTPPSPSTPWSVELTQSVSRPADPWTNGNVKVLAYGAAANQTGTLTSTSLPAGNNDHTLESWIKIVDATATASTSKLFLAVSSSSTARQLSVSIADGGSSTFPALLRIKHGSVTQACASAGIPVNQWTHVAVAFSAAANASDVFINGSYVETMNHSNVVTIPSTGVFAVGSAPCGIEIDEVRVWTSKRTSAQISGAYLSPLVGNEENLFAYYDFEQGTPDGNNSGANVLLDKQTNRAAKNITLGVGFTLNSNSSVNSRANWTQRVRAALPAPTVSYAGSDASAVPAAGTWKIRVESVGLNNRPNKVSIFKDGAYQELKNFITLGISNGVLDGAFGAGKGTHTFGEGQYEPYMTFTYISDGTSITSSSVSTWA